MKTDVGAKKIVLGVGIFIVFLLFLTQGVGLLPDPEYDDYTEENRDEYFQAVHNYHSIISAIVIVIGIAVLVIGYFLLKIDELGIALMASGIGAIILGSENLYESGYAWRFILYLVAFTFLIFIITKFKSLKNVNQTNGKKLVLGAGVFIVFMLLLIQGITLVYPDVNYGDFEDYDEYKDEDNKRNLVVSVICIVIGISIIILGYFLLKLDIIGIALMASGIGAIIIGGLFNWSNFGEMWRFLLLLVAFVFLILLAIRLNKKKQLL